MQKKRVQKKLSSSVALFCARGLGDALLFMILAHNLSHAGYSVTTFSSILYELKDWFPSSHILPFPDSQCLQQTLVVFDRVIATDHSFIAQEAIQLNNLDIVKEADFNKKSSMVNNLVTFCRVRLSIPAQSHIGIFPPVDLKFKAYSKRVVIHPTSGQADKNWRVDKFLSLASRLEKIGYSPYFCTSPSERRSWKNWVAEDKLPQFSTISSLAAFIYESSYLIGNDSGVGHLASALDIPTLTLFARKSYSQLWRPGWGEGSVITPPSFLLGIHLKQKYWQQCLTVGRVLKAFKKSLREKR